MPSSLAGPGLGATSPRVHTDYIRHARRMDAHHYPPGHPGMGTQDLSIAPSLAWARERGCL